VDDDRIYIFGLTKLIEMNEFCEELLVFQNGKDALENLLDDIRLGRDLPSVILLDINMPVMDGWQFLDEFEKLPTERKHGIRVYMVSSSVNQTDLDKAKSYPDIVDYVIKPVKASDLERIANDFDEAVSS
jgi:CheY-like chemotaxis protein